MLPQRILVSCVLVPALIGLCYLDAHAGASAPWLLGLCLILAIRSVWELVDLMTVRTIRPQFGFCAAFCVSLVIAGWWPHQPAGALFTPWGALLTVFFGAILGAMLLGAAQFEEPGRSLENVGGNLFIVAYVGLLLAGTMQLRWVGPNGAWGYLALGGLIVSTKAGDIGAYTLGRLFGKRKMAPRLSPGKTWMGAVGAVLFAAGASALWYQFATRPLGGHSSPNVLWPLIHGSILGVVGLIGDLCESLIKRDVGRKDAAALFPGFGGLLDLLDSILFAGPVAVLLWQLLPIV